MPTPLQLRIFRSFKANYYEDDILMGPAAYPPEYFDELATAGFNAVWLRGILRHLVDAEPLGTIGDATARHQEALGQVIERARRRGVKVLLYLNEPLCFPSDHAFWRTHAELAGARGDSSMDEWYDTRALCTSTPAVQAWLKNAATALFRALPDLGGWFLITASEHHTHCYSHCFGAARGAKPDCPRCADRSASNVTAEVIRLLRDGTRAASPTAHCLAWNWSWECLEPDPQPRLVAQLPKDMVILADFERGGWMTMPGGRQKWMDEYSLSYAGPTARFIRLRDEAWRHGLAVMAKLQIGTTHELATVPNLPLIDNLYEKLVRCEAAGVTGILATWNFGNAFSLNTAAVGKFSRDDDRPGPRLFVERLAAEHFPGADAGKVGEAVERFSATMRHYPFSIPLLYSGPVNYALAYPLTLKPLSKKKMGRSWIMDERGDDLADSLTVFGLEDTVRLFTTMAAEWQDGVAVIEAALAGCAAPEARRELGVARIIGLVFRSTANVYRTYALRRDWPRNRHRQFRAIVKDEIVVLEAALPLVEADPRLGFHAECQGYMFTPALIRKKLAGLRRALRPR